MMALAAFWSLVLTFESAAPTIELKIFWSRMEYFSNMGIPLMFLWFIQSYDLEKSVSVRRYNWVFWIVPVITLLLVFTSHFHTLIWTGFSWSPMGENVLIYHHGPAFYVAMIYSLLLVLLGNILLIRFVRKRPRYFKSRIWFVLAGSAVPFLTGLIYTIGSDPLEGLDISPMGIVVAGAFFFWGIARGQLFDIVPAGHQFTIEKMTDGAIVLDPHNFIMDVNPVALETLKIHETLTGRRLDIVLPAVYRVLEEGKTTEKFNREVWMDPPVSRWFDIMYYPLKDPHDKQLGGLMILHDITLRKKDELELKKLATELTELNAMKDKLYSLIGHDLRSPFNAILGYAELLAESYDEYSDKERRQFALSISIASKSAFNLLENLLEWSRIQMGRTVYAPEELNLNLMVNETFLLLRLNAQDKGIQLRNRVLPQEKIYADKNMASAILRNLISNGIKFTSTGGCVEVTAVTRERMVEITVADTGIGMKPEKIKTLFRLDAIQSTQGTAHETGTGLGLLLCREFIEKHGGTLTVSSEEGLGSRFVFTLPVLGG
jgi:signal transduction histidine kinase